MRFSREAISRIVEESGFRWEYVEKVSWLMELLEALNRHPFLDGKLVLKGGTALNLFYYPLPRLSVDIDLNYIGGANREKMLEEKPNIEKSIEGVCQRLGLTVRRKPDEHSGGKWSLRYPSVITPSGNLELDLNSLLRVPLWDCSRMKSISFGELTCTNILVLDLHEIAAGKLAALFARSAPRDVFDSVRLLEDSRIKKEQLRLGFILYGAMSRRDWREVKNKDIDFPAEQFRNEVSVLLKHGEEDKDLAAKLIQKCRQSASEALFPFRNNELEFLRLLNEEGVIQPELLSNEKGLNSSVLSHPALKWKAHNVRKFRGLPDIQQ